MLIGNGNKTNNQEKQNNVNTRAKQFMNKDGFYPSTLLVGYWNEMISLKMHPALPREKQTQSSVFDYNQAISTSLTIDKAMILLKKIDEVILPAIYEGRVASTAVLIGLNNLVQIGSGLKGEVRPFVAIHKGLDADSKIPTESIYYEFVNSNDQSLSTIDNFDPETGSYESSATVHAEFFVFRELLLESIRGLMMVSAHADRYVNKYYKDKVSSDLAEIGGKMGLQLRRESTGFSSYGNRSNGITFGNSSNNVSNMSAPTNSLNNLSDIDSFLD